MPLYDSRTREKCPATAERRKRFISRDPMSNGDLCNLLRIKAVTRTGLAPQPGVTSALLDLVHG